MREFLIGVLTIATGVVLAAVVMIVAYNVLKPSHISIDLSKYDCGTDWKKIECSRT